MANLSLDIGCGYHPAHIRRGYISIDIETTKDKVPNFVCADAHNLPFQNNIFQQIFMHEVIEHVENPTRCLKEARRVLEAKGELVVATPHPYLLRKILRMLIRFSLSDTNPHHIAIWTPIEMQNLMRKSGLRLISFSYGMFHTRHQNFDRLLSEIVPERLSFLGHRSCIYVAVAS